MNAVDNLSPRSSYESGKNASGPGLTAAAVKDDFGDTQWSLEAGALVKAHNGVAAIDEIDKMEKDSLSRLHSALEKQRLEINKAGIDATLKCETSLLASGNPSDSRFNKYDSDQEQIEIVDSLMDRFDLVFTFKDIPDEEQDNDIADIKLKSRMESGLAAKNQMDAEERTTGNAEIPEEKMKAWVALARRECRPVLTKKDVRDRLKEFYVDIRLENKDSPDDDEAPVPATVRTLDGLMRLSEASARMRLSQEVEMIDAEMAIAMVKISLQDVGYDPETGQMDADFAAGRGSYTQNQRKNKIIGLIETLETEDTGADPQEVVGMAVEAGIEEGKAEQMIEKLKNGKSAVYTPPNGGLRIA
jgi:replicative DNA helicase Mcm